MEHLKRDELEQRAADIILNMTVLTTNNKIGLHPSNAEGEFWMIMWTHVLEEFVIRFGAYPAGFKDSDLRNLVNIPKPGSPYSSKACELSKRLKLEPGKYLFKFGKTEHLEESFKNGFLRISPAGSYSDASLNYAIRDEELEFTIQPNPQEIKMEVLDPITKKVKGLIKPINGKITKSTATNYYVFCMAQAFYPRLFLDFSADCCLIITDPKRFLKNIDSEFRKKKPDWVGAWRNVDYLDPLNTPINKIRLFFCKHFKYSYQKEFRIVWLPPSNKNRLEHLYITLPEINEYTQLVTLDDI